jgi:hypothetical protein
MAERNREGAMEQCEYAISKQLLEYIGWREDILEMVFDTATGAAHAVSEYSIAVPRMTVPIDRYYRDQRKRARRIPGERFPTIVDYLIWEALLNSAEHGNAWDQDKKIHIVVLLGDKGIIIGCRDEGEFFKQVEVKEKFETKERIKEQQHSGRGMGTRCMYLRAEEIEVDIETGTLFLTVRYE